ncbi:hypothetical protein CCUG60885_02816 [Mycobacteroides salmoniphilum]|uniref:Uncharacterized protein n=1 Tax=Mycobacteroides salmoniphilum TaxID=404941 RepID=A0A4R8SIF6_9MYCO|nr:hypothetical protein CCUG60885_02816 [Mycobacteroides salmoniphilum]TEA05767.1 hypothetical protein CCUG60883_03073 [Mycobacteroides salmoniphilum]
MGKVTNVGSAQQITNASQKAFNKPSMSCRFIGLDGRLHVRYRNQ